MAFEVSFLTYVVATVPPSCSELVQVTLNLIPDKLPALNPGMMLPEKPSMAFLGVKLSLANIPNSIPLLYRPVITRV